MEASDSPSPAAHSSIWLAPAARKKRAHESSAPAPKTATYRVAVVSKPLAFAGQL
eukprot:COSAG01_NODE_1721_length_9391_cov_5.427249_10_plen_55_part_00